MAKTTELGGPRRRSRWVIAGLTASLALGALLGCGDDDSAGSDGEERELVVAAASSLTEAFQAYGESRPGTERFSFAGSDALAAQIRQGASPDVYAAADPAITARLAAAELISEPVAFASNRLVIAVRSGSTIGGAADLAEPGVELAIGASGVPAGDYARELIARLPATRRAAILDNVRSEEPDVRGVLAKVAQGAADAGFVYATDVAAAAGVEAVELPRRLAPRVIYAAATVAGTAAPKAAEAFVAGLRSGEGEAALRAAGFVEVGRAERGRG